MDKIEISKPEAHLLCYDLKRRRGHRPTLDFIELWVSNEFGDDQRLSVEHPEHPKRLCVSSSLEGLEPGAVSGSSSELELDNFLCYGVRADSPGFDLTEVSLADQFQTSDRLLKKPKLLCNPVDQNGEGILDPETHLTCYEVKPLEGEPRLRDVREDVLVSTDFAAEQRFTLKKPKTVCVPSIKEFVED
jgi:hypothetical protein